MKKIINSVEDMAKFGEKFAEYFSGGEVIELIGDVGAGKTSFVKGFAVGLGIDETVQSPSYTISRVYDCKNNLKLCHYDFYRLSDAGIMTDELLENINDKNTITVIEWSDSVSDVLPSNRTIIKISMISETERLLDIQLSSNLEKMDLC